MGNEKGGAVADGFKGREKGSEKDLARECGRGGRTDQPAGTYTQMEKGGWGASIERRRRTGR